jgi:hypothetical protein
MDLKQQQNFQNSVLRFLHKTRGEILLGHFFQAHGVCSNTGNSDEAMSRKKAEAEYASLYT